MMFLNYDLARTLLEERRADAMADSRRRLARSKARQRPPEERAEAEVIELVFGPQCDTGQIGA